jgi:zinc transporter ZupT
MTDATLVYVVWALFLGAVSAVSLPLGSLVGLNLRFQPRYIPIFAAFGAGVLIAALSVELVAPTALALTEQSHAGSSEQAYAHFFAMLAGGVLGGLVFVPGLTGLGTIRAKNDLRCLALAREDVDQLRSLQSERSGIEHVGWFFGRRNVQAAGVEKLQRCG